MQLAMIGQVRTGVDPGELIVGGGNSSYRDVGGTNTRLALFGRDPRTPARLEVYDSRRHDGLRGLIGAFLSGRLPD